MSGQSGKDAKMEIADWQIICFLLIGYSAGTFVTLAFWIKDYQNGQNGRIGSR